MFQLHDFSVYHPNSYIASRRSSLPRQGYGGVYERRISLGAALTPSPSSTYLREGRHGVLPRPFSDFSLRRSAASSSSSDLPTGADPVEKSAVAESTSESSSELTASETDEVTARLQGETATSTPTTSSSSSSSAASSPGMDPKVTDRPPSPPLTLPEVSVRWRSREDEEKSILWQLMKLQTAKGRVSYVPSVHFSNLVAEYSGLDVMGLEELQEDGDCSSATNNIEESMFSEWNTLIFNLVNRKKKIRIVLDKEYRDAKRQASQMRQSFECYSEQVVSRFDRLISDILCYARLVCHLARQSARFGKEGSPIFSDSNFQVFIEDKRNLLKQQLSELPRLRRSLLLRQASLIRMCTDDSTEEDLRQRFSSYWSYAIQLCIIDSEIVLDKELTQ